MSPNASWYELEVHTPKGGGFTPVLDSKKKPIQFKEMEAAEDYIFNSDEGELYSIVACTVNRTILKTIRKKNRRQ